MLEVSGTQKIVDFIVNIEYNSIPQEAIAIAKNAICDSIGVAIASANEPVSRILSEHVKSMTVKGESGVICKAFKTTADLAAWVNSTMSHNLDYDDTFPKSTGYNFHPTVVTLPAILALAEKLQASGKDVLASYAAAVELEFYLGSVMGRHSSELGWHPTAVLGVIGAAVASARMLRLNNFKAAAAIGIACSFAAGMMRNSGSMTKPLHAGNAARNGVVAALLAKSGLTSNENILEGQFGFINLFSGGKVCILSNDIGRLGRDWKILSHGIAFKPYPCCRGTHSSIDAALHLREKYKIQAEEISAVICKTSPVIPKLLLYHRPKSGLQGKFSLEYCVATSLLRGKPKLEDFTDEGVNNPQVQVLLSKVNYLHPEGWVEGPDLTQEVTIRLKKGQEHSCKVSSPKGEPENPMSREELIDKFSNCVMPILTQNRVDYFLGLLENICSLDNIAILMDSLTFCKEMDPGKG